MNNLKIIKFFLVTTALLFNGLFFTNQSLADKINMYDLKKIDTFSVSSSTGYKLSGVRKNLKPYESEREPK